MAHLASRINASGVLYANKMDSINAYMKKREFPNDLRIAMRKYYKHFLSKRTVFNEEAILAELSVQLRGKVARFLVSKDIYGMPFFESREPECLALLLTLMKPVYFDTGEVVFAEGQSGKELYILVRGSVSLLVQGVTVETVFAGSFQAIFGEAGALDLQEQRPVTVIAVDRSELYALEPSGACRPG